MVKIYKDGIRCKFMFIEPDKPFKLNCVNKDLPQRSRCRLNILPMVEKNWCRYFVKEDNE